MQRINTRILLSRRGGAVRHTIPLRDKILQVVMHVLFELAYRLGAEGVGNRLAFPCVLRSISGVEETTVDGDEGVIVITIRCAPC